MSTLEQLQLDQLGDTYQIIGELAGREDARVFLAKRNSDGLGVLIVISAAPAADEANALSQLAADTYLLAGASHRCLLPILEGRWLNDDAYAVVTERTAWPTLEEVVVREPLSLARTATILQEINGLLEWAREQKVMHRALAPDTVFVEPGSDRVAASFAIAALPPSGRAGIHSDARTIAGLAKTMLGDRYLPGQLSAETEALLNMDADTDVVPDLSGYLAMIAMADALAQGEVELSKAQNAINEQERIAREQLEAERRKHDEELAEQQAKFAKERKNYEKKLSRESAAFEKERAALASERAAHERDCAELEEARAALEADREAYHNDRSATLTPSRRLRPNRGWVVPAAIVLLLVIAVSAVAINRHRWTSEFNRESGGTALKGEVTLIPGSGVADSVAGAVATPLAPFAPAMIEVDSARAMPSGAFPTSGAIAGPYQQVPAPVMTEQLDVPQAPTQRLTNPAPVAPPTGAAPTPRLMNPAVPGAVAPRSDTVPGIRVDSMVLPRLDTLVSPPPEIMIRPRLDTAWRRIVPSPTDTLRRRDTSVVRGSGGE